jgi:diguanylate cyclase (GGDEF)-like protein/PAS domain S-box-containing protein
MKRAPRVKKPVRRYILPLGLIAVLSAAAFTALHVGLRTQATGTRVLQANRDQRMWSQRVALLAVRFAESRDPSERQALRRALGDLIHSLQRSHEALLAGSEGLGLPGQLSPEVKAMYFTPPINADSQVRTFIERANVLLQSRDAAVTRQNRDLESLVDMARFTLPNALEAVGAQLELEAELEIQRLDKIARILMGLTLLTILLSALFVYRPVLWKMQREKQLLGDAKDQLDSILETAGEAILVMRPDGTILKVNREVEEIWGHAGQELIGTKLPRLLTESSGERYATDGLYPARLRFELEGARKDGSVFPLEIRVSESRTRLGILHTLVLRDLTDRKQLEAELRVSEKKYRSILENVKQVIFQTDEAGAWTFLNSAWTEITGFKLEESIGRNFINHVHPDDRDANSEAYRALLLGQKEYCRHEVRYLTKGGASRWMEVYARPTPGPEGAVVGVSGTLHEITERKEMTDQLEYQAFYDGLTNLPNRALFMDRLGRTVNLAKRRPEHMFAVLLVDADRFKVVNDSLGHMIGDQLLIGIARRLEACLRLGDTVARLGGDEFALLIDDMEEVNDATRVAERIQKELKLPFNLSGQEVIATASIGIALSTTGYDNPEDLLRDADIALYRAKALGKARHEMFDSEMHVQAMALMQLEADLRRAVKRAEFRIHYQPIVSLRTGRITRCEALARWHHPRRGVISPAEFIPLAEETGLIIPIGEWLLRTACTQNKAWQDAGHKDMRVTVNIAARQFQHPHFLQTVADTLKETGLAPESLDLEITESAAMRSLDVTIAGMQVLKEMGVHLSIDDFGTGYSSLAYLKRFPIDTLKVAQSFVRDITVDPEDQALTAAIIALSSSLKLKVIAEGVETEEQLAFLRSTTCDEIQGFYFSLPVPGEECTRLLEEGRTLPPAAAPEPERTVEKLQLIG